jgi:ATP-dependent RNA helicase RhlE
MTDFAGLKLIQPLLRALSDEGYATPTPIQGKAIPVLIEGRDLIGIAQTGTGKTAAFALPMLQRLAASDARPQPKSARALILAPTRELAAQIGDSFKTYGKYLKLRSEVVFGGVPIHRQITRLAPGVDILVATPGRLVDLWRQKCVRLENVEIFVLDEADRMLDMGFIPDVKRIAGLIPKQRQTMLFSATMPQTIQQLSGFLLVNPAKVEVTPAATTAEKVEQRVLFVQKANKRAALAGLLRDDAIDKVLVFTRTKHGANKVVRQLEDDGIRANAIHGNKSQSARQKALDEFRSGRTPVLVATDIASRGIDVDGVTHVINFELPNEPESYVHRIGRTARAGATGIAISLVDAEERSYLRDIEKTIRQPLVVQNHNYGSASSVSVRPAANEDRPRHNNGGGNHRGGHNGGGRNGQHTGHSSPADGQKLPARLLANGAAQGNERADGAERPRRRRRRRSGSGGGANHAAV